MKKENREKFKKEEVMEVDKILFQKYNRKYPLAWLFF